MRKQQKPGTQSVSSNRSAFTLVEMLVAVALILLMMSMFASIFSIASSSVSKQRGIAENDQRARSFATIMRSDFQKRTKRYPLAFYPGEDPATSPTSFESRPGYIYLSTNDPYSGLDDKLQFTIDADLLTENRDGTPYFGRADLLGDRTTNTSNALAAANPGTLPTAINPNQPEVDDGALIPNGTGSSNIAEVTLFVRNGKLYRRIVLIRKPLEVAGKDFGPQPTTSFGDNLLGGLDGSGTYDGLFGIDRNQDGSITNPDDLLTNNFYNHFDYAAIAFVSGGQQHAQLIGVGALSNDPTANGGAAISLGIPTNRFGFTQTNGRSREHTSIARPYFIGGYTHAETSALNFNWPQQNARVQDAVEDAGAVFGTGNPLDIVNAPVTINPSNGVIAEFDGDIANEGRGGSRRFEDLLLANVHEFRVEIWDERLQRFETPGHNSFNPATGHAGDYHVSRNMNLDYGPLANLSLGRVFDTWHPGIQVDIDGNGTIDADESHPPYIAYDYYPPDQDDLPPGPSPVGMPGPVRTYWNDGSPYTAGVDVVFAPWVDQPNGGNPPDGLFSYSEMPEPKFQIAYRCVVSGTSGPISPIWPRAPGRRITDGSCVWESFDNRRPLQSMRVTVRFMDQTTDTMRQVSLIMPMTDKEQ
ncbi:MAG: prepilin-type N-terminal cleavage/methylation domain-containing protein [Planctomyces sp.]|nr:prepilin-type N-terminal cleavage/methylation domain-containing protein [Planctomyces sp.]